MTKKLLLSFLAIALLNTARTQVVLNSLTVPYSQDFNTLVNSATSSVLPTGWALLETGAGANATYTASIGSSGTGDTYSFGSNGVTERAFGTLQSGNVIPSIGVQFNNNSGTTITSITINYTGEQWRLGALARLDKLDFQYSVDATTLSTGIWTDENNLDFTAPVTTGTAGPLDGNNVTNKTIISAVTITGLNIASGSNFWLRWTDFNAAGADDGLGVDDFTIAFNGNGAVACAEPTTQPSNLILTPSPTTIDVSFTASVPPADEYIVVRSNSLTLSAGPVDGTPYSVGSPLGGGTVVSTGTTTSFIDNGLAPSTDYYYFVFGLNSDGCTGGPNYLNTNPLTGTIGTLTLPNCVTPTAPATNLILTPGSISVSGSFTVSATANRYLVIRSLNSTLSASPANGTTYSTGQTLGGGTVVSYSNSNSFSALGLNQGTLYYLFVFAASGDCGGEPFYNTNALSGSATTLTGNGIPPGYYNAATGLTCSQLKTALFNIISANYNQLSYTPGVWDAYQTTDMHRNDANNADIIWDMYSDNPAGAEPYTYAFGTGQCGDYSGEGYCYNREHSFPKSWFNDASPMYSDINHLFPTDGFVNGKRGNQSYGEVSSPTWTSQNGSKLGPNTYPGFSGVVFEPRNEYKGDFARAHLYMVTRYENLVAGWQNNGNANDILSGNAYPALDQWYINMLYKWHTQDPVSQKEIDRNNAVYGLQGNRNPFIDHPEYVYDIWSCAGIVIPVTILDFTASKYNESILLNWKATRETSFKSYNIERSIDGISFIKIGTVAGRNLANYDFTDRHLPVAKNVFYRLKMIDIDGKFNYSKTVSIKLNEQLLNAAIYPNPTAGLVNVKLSQPLSKAAYLIITDMAGRSLLQTAVSAMQNNITVDVKQIPMGTYHLVLTDGSNNIHQTLVIIR